MELDNLNLNGVLNDWNSLKFAEIMGPYQNNDVLKMCVQIEISKQLSHWIRLKWLLFCQIYSNICFDCFYISCSDLSCPIYPLFAIEQIYERSISKLWPNND